MTATQIILLALSVAYVLFIVFIIYWAGTRQRRLYQERGAVISDADLFRMMNENAGFMTAEELAAHTSLSVKEAQKHLMYLANKRIIKCYYEMYGMHQRVYQLIQYVPMTAPKVDLQQLSDQAIVELLTEYSSNGQFTVAETMVILGCSLEEAQALLKRLQQQKLLRVLDRWFYPIYLPQLGFQNSTTEASPEKMALPMPQERIKIPDAEVLQLAIENGGALTPAALCVKGKIPLAEAQKALEHLYEQGAFTLDADQTGSVLEYQLRDPSLRQA